MGLGNKRGDAAMMGQPCIPDLLPIETLNWRRLVPLISLANQEIARFDGALRGMVNPDILMSPLRSQEAVLSSRIEGTQATLAEVLEHDAGTIFYSEKLQDIKEIINYRRALKIGVDMLQDRPITLSLIRELHQILMDSVRGKDKEPGRFRMEQNWIGPLGCTIEQARFVPPSPIVMNDFLENFEQFMHTDYDDVLIQLAFIHAQFEIIHPFKDGNGRLGRILIPLFLYQKHVIKQPVFYLSEYLEQNDRAYRDHLLAITAHQDWEGWIAFFLTGIVTQSRSNLSKAEAIHHLYQEMKDRFQKATNSRHVLAALDAFFATPILKSSDFVKSTGISRSQASVILDALCSAGIVELIRRATGPTPAYYRMTELLDIAEGRR